MLIIRLSKVDDSDETPIPYNLNFSTKSIRIRFLSYDR
jgi:hypothetical protein